MGAEEESGSDSETHPEALMSLASSIPLSSLPLFPLPSILFHSSFSFLVFSLFFFKDRVSCAYQAGLNFPMY